MVTSLDKTKQGPAVAISLPNKSDFGNDIQDRVLEGIPRDELIKDTGLETLVKFLQEILGKEDIDDLAVKWDEFENCRRGDDEKIEDFVGDFERKYNRLVKMKVEIPEDVRAPMLMKKVSDIRVSENAGSQPS